MSKLEKMAKKLVSGLILAHLAQFRAANFFFSKIWLRQSLDIIAIIMYNIRKKLMIQS